MYVRLGRVAASASTVRYAVRHYTPEEPTKRLMNVQGYGVELAIKSTEYKVIDDKVPEKDKDGDDEQQSGQEQDSMVQCQTLSCSHSLPLGSLLRKLIACVNRSKVSSLTSSSSASQS